MGAIHKAAIASLILILLVISAGSIVRMTGSGMGCPDWPKCFGHIVPPTHEVQVLWQPNKAYNKGQMIVKDNAMWSATSDFTSGSQYNSANWEKYTRHNYAKFNATHTWIEYINRLLGAASGVPVLLLFVLSLLKIKSKPILALLSGAVLFTLGYEAWLGKLVVDGNLVPNAITKHMFGSLVIVGLLMFIISMTLEKKRVEVTRPFKFLVIGVLVLVASQILLGTQVREQIDEIAKITTLRSHWISMLDITVLVHRSFSIVIFLSGIWLFWRNYKNDYAFYSLGVFLVFVFAEIIAGAVMYYFDIPKWLQPVHLLLSVGMFASVVWALARSRMR